MTLNVFARNHVRRLSEDFDITLMANGSVEDVSRLVAPGVVFQPVPIRRPIAPVSDLAAIVVLWRLFSARHFDAVQSITPKAGLLAMVAAWLARIPVRVHWFTGQVWATRLGLARWGLKQLDRLTANCASTVLVDSPSQCAFLVKEGVVSADRATVLGLGSISGVDALRFAPNQSQRAHVRRELGIAEGDVVALFVGRLNREKGLPEMAAAFARVARRHSGLRLVIVGPDEESMRDHLLTVLGAEREAVVFVDYVPHVETYMASADFLILASHREGFGSTVIEAAACGIPAIGTRIYGLTDAIVDGDTGLLVPVADIDALAHAIEYLATQTDARVAMGARARRRALEDFSETRITGELVAFYRTQLAPGAQR